MEISSSSSSWSLTLLMTPPCPHRTSSSTRSWSKTRSFNRRPRIWLNSGWADEIIKSKTNIRSIVRFNNFEISPSKFNNRIQYWWIFIEYLFGIFNPLTPIVSPVTHVNWALNWPDQISPLCQCVSAGLHATDTLWHACINFLTYSDDHARQQSGLCPSGERSWTNTPISSSCFEIARASKGYHQAVK